jgi:hypothetical protein
MATTHTYIITSVTQLGDQLTITGTVDGVAVTVSTWASAAGALLASALGFRSFIAPLMLAALPPAPTELPQLHQSFTV